VLLPDAGAFGIALLSRLPLRDVRPFWLESTHAIDARIATPDGALRLIGVHLRPPTTAAGAAERSRQLDALAGIVEEAGEPLAIAGDFNLTPYSPYFTRWLRETRLRDTRTGSGLGFTWPTFLPVVGIPIDHCIVSPEVAVAAFRRLPAFGSDHYPIVVELIMEGEQ
jgi:endonuclease/exonuclease/phosphatase family metal-dependent hydrolase